MEIDTIVSTLYARVMTPPLRPGQLLEVTPSELVAGGDAIARVDGFPLFVRGIFPGDLARVEITEVKKGFARAVLDEVLAAGPLRRAEPCPIADDCGGCDWTALRLDHQLDAKVRILRESLRRVGKFDPDGLPPVHVHPSPLNYRIRSRLQFDRDRDAFGFFALRSNRVVPVVRECEVIGPATVQRLGALHAQTRAADAGAVEVFEVDEGVVANPLTSGADAGEAPAVSLSVGEYRYQLSTGSFFQVNRHLLPRMLDLVDAHADSVRTKGVAYDLYAGVGFFSLPLAKRFDRVFSVEGAAASQRYARLNAKGYPAVKTIGSSVEKFAAGRMRADFVMLDPPRAGVAPAVLDSISGSGAEKICYLSCDPVTFSRDVARLVRRGWALHTLDLLDLFPNTHHIETLSSLVRAA